MPQKNPSENTKEVDEVAVLVSDLDSLERFKKLYGYCGHNFDLPITWVDYNQSPLQVAESLRKVLLKLFRNIQEGIEAYKAFKDTKKWGEFYDPNAKRHSRWLYRKISNKRDFNKKKKSNKLNYYSAEKNKKFFSVANSLFSNP